MGGMEQSGRTHSRNYFDVTGAIRGKPRPLKDGGYAIPSVVGEIVNVPTPADALRGGPLAPRKRNNHGYNPPMFIPNPNSASKPTTRVPRDDRTFAVDERNHEEP